MKPTTIFFAKLLAELVKDTPQETRDFTKEIFAESDRGVALICTEDLNLKLELLFRMRFSISKPQVKKIVDPLATFRHSPWTAGVSESSRSGLGQPHSVENSPCAAGTTPYRAALPNQVKVRSGPAESGEESSRSVSSSPSFEIP